LVRVVGFGRKHWDEDGAWMRRTGRSLLAEVAPTTLTLAPDPSLPCFGDSGGAVIDESRGDRRIVGVVSYGDADCTGHAVATRVDAYTARFLDPFALAGTVAAGGRCLFDDNCANGRCVSPTGPTGSSYCDAPCSDSSCAAPL